MAGPLSKRPHPLSIRLNEVERTALERRAGGVGLSTYAKSVLFGEEAGSSRRRSVSADRALLAAVLGQLGVSGLGASMGRLADAAKTGSLHVDKLTTDRLHHACDDIAEMRLLLMAALGMLGDAKSMRPRAAFRTASSAESDR